MFDKNNILKMYFLIQIIIYKTVNKINAARLLIAY